jgi:hypothetical protein
MNMLLGRKGDEASACKFMYEWVQNAARQLTKASTVDALEQHLVMSAAYLSFIAEEEDSLTELHEAVESFFGGSVEACILEAVLLPPAGMPFGFLLENAEKSALSVGIARMLDSTTLRQHLVKLISDSKARRSIDLPSPLFKGEASKEIIEQLSNPLRRPRFIEQIDVRPFCPHCFKSFPSAMATHLIARRIGYHSCGWFTVRTKS